MLATNQSSDNGMITKFLHQMQTIQDQITSSTLINTQLGQSQLGQSRGGTPSPEKY